MRFLCVAPSLLLLGALSAHADTVDVAARDYRFLPAEIRVKVGDTVKWTNEEKRVSHSVLFTGDGGLESDRFFPGESWQRTFDKAGIYPYTCGPHPEMKGIVVVE